MHIGSLVKLRTIELQLCCTLVFFFFSTKMKKHFSVFFSHNNLCKWFSLLSRLDFLNRFLISHFPLSICVLNSVELNVECHFCLLKSNNKQNGTHLPISRFPTAHCCCCLFSYFPIQELSFFFFLSRNLFFCPNQTRVVSIIICMWDSFFVGFVRIVWANNE